MFFRCCLASLVTFVSVVPLLSASEEEFLPWMEVRIAGPERPDTGKVVFVAKLAGDKYKEVSIEAFGKRHDLSKEQLKQLAGFPLTSLKMTHEAGYPQLGGHTVHVYLTRTGALNAAGKVAKEQILISVSKGKGLTISEIKTSLVSVK